MKVKTETIDGRKVAIELGADGTFEAQCDGDEWTDKTLEGVIAKVRRDLRKSKVRIAIPATAIGVELHKPQFGHAHSRSATGKVRHLTITGVHGRSGNILARWEDTGESEQISGWRNEGSICRRLTPDEVKQYAALAKAKKAADDAIEKFEKRISLGGRKDIKEFVEQAIKEKVDDPKEDDEADDDGDPR